MFAKKTNFLRGIIYSDGMAAINLETPERVTHTEYSVDSHWELVKAATGIEVSYESSQDIKERAAKEFMKAQHFRFTLPQTVDFTAFNCSCKCVSNSGYFLLKLNRK